MKKFLLTVAGFDPTSGAGTTLDLRVFRRFGYYGLAVLTSVTVQNSRRVYEYLDLPAEFILKQYRKLTADLRPDGLKLGMLGSQKAFPAIEEILSASREIPVVVDPVFRSSSGCWLLEKESLKDFLKLIKGKINLLTPNLAEASLITGKRIDRPEKMVEAARKIAEMIDGACLIKGGHLRDQVVDVLYDGQKIYEIKKKKIPLEVHGTGCFFSSAILCFLARGEKLPSACREASSAIKQAMKSTIRGKGRSLFAI
ncbi:MAG: bifunctional hydroxymethylpyrimidine kinase/phosphomethylpyrimidine kinase [Candidatus Saccharicenans sp.]|nr:bifunctional hydroxymethylpyrimidine kinase/phosphomethylpyrimidine kinase [Candidatus Saccharicenans sp.]